MDSDGFSVVEVLLSVVILSLFVMAAVGAALYGQEGTALAGSRNRAAALASEGLEADRNLRDANYANLITGTHGLSASGGSWNLTGLSDLTDIFTRQQQIATAAGSDDRRDVTSSATWQQNLQRSGTMMLTTRLTNWQRALGDWSAASVQSTVNISGNQNANKVAWQGSYAYVVRNTGTPDFAVIDVSNSASPALVGSLTLTGSPTNVFILGNYAYVTSADNSGELKIIDVSTPSAPVQVGTFNAPANADANGVFVEGTTAYLTRDTSANNFVIVDVTTPGTPAQLSILSLGGPLFESVVVGGYAYVSTGDGAAELRVVDVTNPLLPASVGSLNLTGGFSAVTIDGYAGVVFLGQTNGTGTVSIAGTTTPSAPVLLSSFAAGDPVNDVALGAGDGYLFLAKDNGAAEFAVRDVSDTAGTVSLGTLNMSAGQSGVVYDTIRDRVYMAGNENAEEFSVLQPL